VTFGPGLFTPHHRIYSAGCLALTVIVRAPTGSGLPDLVTKVSCERYTPNTLLFLLFAWVFKNQKFFFSRKKIKYVNKPFFVSLSIPE
jgi:hypothetical protein